jgi:very-short-patch-repair endonuclease
VGVVMNAPRQPKRRKRIILARRLRREVTEPERKLWRNLKQLPIGTSHFRRQAPIGPYFADFACHQIRLVIEIDGESHTAIGAAGRDESRSVYFQSKGYRVLRFWNYDVMQNIEGVMTIIHETVAANAVQEPPPLTPPRASRGRGPS